MRRTMDPNVIKVGVKEYPTCGSGECDLLVLEWLGMDVSDVEEPRDVKGVSTERGSLACVPLVVPFGMDAFCAACGVFVMHGVFCQDTYHANLGAPHPDFADLS